MLRLIYISPYHPILNDVNTFFLLDISSLVVVIVVIAVVPNLINSFIHLKEKRVG